MVKERVFVTMGKNVGVQEVFLIHVRKNRIPLTIYLVNGVKLQGVIIWFDKHTILLRRDTTSQLIYKHAISTIVPHGLLEIFESPTLEENVQQEINSDID